jgi:hypothetical protein
MSKNLIFNIDWGLTIGFSVIDLEGNLILTGSTNDENLVINVFYSLLPNIHTFSYEVMQIIPSEYYRVIEKALQLCEEFTPSIVGLSPNLWKNSHCSGIKRQLSKHEIESYRQSMYTLYKQNRA